MLFGKSRGGSGAIFTPWWQQGQAYFKR